MNPATIIALFSIFILACLCLFFVLFFGSERASTPVEFEVRDSIAGLSSANAPGSEMLFSDRDYRALLSRPELKIIAAKLRQDRRRIALSWLAELERDVRLVWEFRRFLVRNGLPVTFREEAEIASAGCCALIYLHAIRLAVFLFGPFLPGTLQSARLRVATLSSRGASLLARAPADVKARLQKKWTQHVLAWSAV